MKSTASGPRKTDGSSRVPIFRNTSGTSGARVSRCVPQFGQNSRVTGRGMSLRVKAFVSPRVSEKPAAGIPMIRTAAPPEMY